MIIEKIVSGGQTGVDRAALDIAIELCINHGGWCPKGRKAEDGFIPDKYVLKETDTDDYSERTKLNIRDSDGTLIFVPSIPIKVTDGTLLTLKEVYERKKPYFMVNISYDKNIRTKFENWVDKNNIKILNIAGPRESQHPGIYKESSLILKDTLMYIHKPTIENLLQEESIITFHK